MTRRRPLPGAAELFRPANAADGAASPAPPVPLSRVPPPPPSTPIPLRGHGIPASPPPGSGRQKHDAKITVYVSGPELVALEHARLALRAQYGIGVDRGRIVREAVAALLADLDEHGEDSALVRRLRGGHG